MWPRGPGCAWALEQFVPRGVGGYNPAQPTHPTPPHAPHFPHTWAGGGRRRGLRHRAKCVTLHHARMVCCTAVCTSPKGPRHLAPGRTWHLAPNRAGGPICSTSPTDPQFTPPHGGRAVGFDVQGTWRHARVAAQPCGAPLLGATAQMQAGQLLPAQLPNRPTPHAPPNYPSHNPSPSTTMGRAGGR
jgi:hypothetical protein